MKHSVRGFIPVSDGSAIVAVVNTYTLWRLVTQDAMDEQSGGDLFTFEAWVNSEADKDALFDDLKPFVDQHGGFIDQHECSHDEAAHEPCVIAETYTAGG